MADIQELLEEINRLSLDDLERVQEFIERRRRAALGTQRDLAQMPDEDVLDLANTTMSDDQAERLSYLLDQQNAGVLNSNDQTELDRLMGDYEDLLLRKSEGLAEAVKRGLRPPLTS